MNVFSNDIIHADQHSAVMIPHDAVKKIPHVVKLNARREKLMLDASKQSDFFSEKLEEVVGQSREIY